MDTKIKVNETTTLYLLGLLKFEPLTPLCTCRSFRYPHELRAHKQLRSDYDWRTFEEREAEEIKAEEWRDQE